MESKRRPIWVDKEYWENNADEKERNGFIMFDFERRKLALRDSMERLLCLIEEEEENYKRSRFSHAVVNFIDDDE